MKCDTCKHSVYSFEIHGLEPYCNAEHWGGGPPPEITDDHTVWDKCKDFECLLTNCTIHLNKAKEETE